MRGTLAAVALLLPVIACPGHTRSNSAGLARTVRAGPGPIDAIAVDPGNSQTVYALQVGSLLESVDGGARWRTINFAGTVVDAFAFDPPRSLYVAGTSSTDDVAFRSFDGGAEWQEVSYPFRTEVNTFAVAPSNRRVLYAGLFGGYGLTAAKSVDGGATWRYCGITGKPWASIDRLAIDPGNPQVVFAVHQGNPFESHVFKTTNGGRRWREIGGKRLAGKGVERITPDQQRPRIVYAASAMGIFKSTDAGAHWQGDGLHGQDVNQVVADPSHPRVLYAATLEHGVFESANGGRGWHRLGLPNEGVEVLAISSDGRVLYAGTDDDGVVRFPVGQ